MLHYEVAQYVALQHNRSVRIRTKEKPLSTCARTKLAQVTTTYIFCYFIFPGVYMWKRTRRSTRQYIHWNDLKLLSPRTIITSTWLLFRMRVWEAEDP